MKTFKLTAIFLLLFSGVFGVTVFHHQLKAGSKITGSSATLSNSLNSNIAAIFDKGVSPQDDNDVLADDSLDDDDDGCFSPREKHTSESNVCIDAIPHSSHNYGLSHFCNYRLSKIYQGNVSHLSHRNFISLRVFRL